MLFRSHFSGTTRCSRRKFATTVAGTPKSRYSPVARSMPGVSSISLFGSTIA